MEYMIEGRQPNLIMKQYYQEAEGDNEARTACVVVDEATGETIVGADSEGGGGDSDFSTVTLTVTSNAVWSLQAPTIIEAVVEEGDVPGASTYVALETGEHTYTIVLYKGAAFGVVEDADSVEISNVAGDIQFNENLFYITGNCSFTLAEK